MYIIELDARTWRSPQDFFRSLKKALLSSREPDDSPDIWIDSIVYGGVNEVNPPYTIRIVGLSACEPDVKNAIQQFSGMLCEAKTWCQQQGGYNIEADICLED